MKADYPSILLIYTGGTIGMIENPETGALENFNFDHLLKHVPELKRFFAHLVRQLTRKQSHNVLPCHYSYH